MARAGYNPEGILRCLGEMGKDCFFPGDLKVKELFSDSEKVALLVLLNLVALGVVEKLSEGFRLRPKKPAELPGWITLEH